MSKEKLFTKLISLFLIFILVLGSINIYIPKVSATHTVYSVRNDREPRITTIKTNKNYLYVILHDDYGIKTSKTTVLLDGKKCNLELFKRSDGSYKKDGTRIDKDKLKANSYSGTRYDYGVKIKNSELTTKYSNMYIYSFDHQNGCFIKENFKMRRYDKMDSKGEYYNVNRAPRVTVSIINNKPSVDAIDYSGIKSIKVLSKKNDEVVYSYYNSETGEEARKNSIRVREPIDMNLIEKAQKDKPGRYRFRICAEDMDGIKSERTMTVYIDKKEVEDSKTEDNDTSSNKTSKESNNTSSKSGLNKSSLYLAVGETYKLSVNAKEYNNTTLTWSTNNNKVAKVSSDGTITAIAKGTATITVKFQDGKTDTCKVSVYTPGANKVTLNGHHVTLPDGDDRVYFLDVSDKNNGRFQGSDAILLESNGQYALIDVAVKYQSSRIIKYLKDIGVKELEFILITHAHYDHMGSIQSSSFYKKSGIKVKKLYIKNLSDGRSSYKSRVKSVSKIAKNQGIQVLDVRKSENQTITCGDFKFKLLNTVDRSKNRNYDENLNSVAAVTTTNGRKLYFTGDIQNKSGINASHEAAKIVGQVDFYKAAHHGYRFNAHKEDLRIINPKYTVITNSKNRKDVPEGVKKIQDYTRVTKDTTYYTASGTVILTIQPDGNMIFTKLNEDK